MTGPQGVVWLRLIGAKHLSLHLIGTSMPLMLVFGHLELLLALVLAVLPQILQLLPEIHGFPKSWILQVREG